MTKHIRRDRGVPFFKLVTRDEMSEALVPPLVKARKMPLCQPTTLGFDENWCKLDGTGWHGQRAGWNLQDTTTFELDLNADSPVPNPTRGQPVRARR